MALATRVVQRRRAQVRSNMVKIMQSQARVHQARQVIHHWHLVEEPIEVNLVPTMDGRARGVVPWSVQLWCAPWGFHGQSKEEGGRFTNLFRNVGADKYRDAAAVKIQSRSRGMVLRKKKGRGLAFGGQVCEEIIEGVWQGGRGVL